MTAEQPTIQPASDDAQVALVVDMDGTLCRTDTLHEAILALLGSEPLSAWRLPKWAAEGRAELKAHLADRGVVDPESLPLNAAVVEMVRAARENGRKTALVSAADHRQVAAVAERVGLFDEAYGSEKGRNLKGREKAAFLKERFGAGMFDYVGDSRADLPVWTLARRAISVQAGQGLQKAVEAVNGSVTHIDPPRGRAQAALKAIRPHQWSKNMLVFLPLVASHDFSRIIPVMLGFLAFCLSASAVYVINDLLDLSADRAHPRKRRRPFAAGDLTAVEGGALAAAFLLAALALVLTTGNPEFLIVLALYLAATFLYSLWLKRKLLVDVLMLAGLYTIRIIAGGTAAGVALSPWLLGFSLFIFLALAAVKRQAELTDLLATDTNASRRAYEADDLPILRGIALSAGQAAVLVLALYINSDDVQTLYAQPNLLWIVCPLLLYWILRMVMKAHRGQMTDDPIVFAATDRVSQLVVLACLVTVFAAVA